MNKATITLAIALSIITTFFVTYYFADTMQGIELQEIKNNYETDTDSLEDTVNSLNDLEENNHKYIKQMMNALCEREVAGLNEGFGGAYYDEASMDYQDDYFEWASLYAGYADTYYSYASTSYRGAKAFFDIAIDYATTEETKQLAQLYYNLSEIDAQISSEMHEACEYFSSACDYYYDNNYDMGGNEIDKMNEHIDAHDALIPEQNDLWSEIDALLENL